MKRLAGASAALSPCARLPRDVFTGLCEHLCLVDISALAHTARAPMRRVAAALASASVLNWVATDPSFAVYDDPVTLRRLALLPRGLLVFRMNEPFSSSSAVYAALAVLRRYRRSLCVVQCSPAPACVMEALAACPNLRDVGGTLRQVEAVGLSLLARCALERLELHGTQCTPAVLAAIVASPTLRELHFRCMGHMCLRSLVGDRAGQRALAWIRTLEWIDAKTLDELRGGFCRLLPFLSAMSSLMLSGPPEAAPAVLFAADDATTRTLPALQKVIWSHAVWPHTLRTPLLRDAILRMSDLGSAVRVLMGAPRLEALNLFCCAYDPFTPSVAHGLPTAMPHLRHLSVVAEEADHRYFLVVLSILDRAPNLRWFVWRGFPRANDCDVARMLAALSRVADIELARGTRDGAVMGTACPDYCIPAVIPLAIPTTEHLRSVLSPRLFARLSFAMPPS